LRLPVRAAVTRVIGGNGADGPIGGWRSSPAGGVRRDFSLVFSMTSATPAGTTTVVVLDSEFRELRTITAAHELALFDRLWSDRAEETEGALRPLCKVSIYRNGRSVRWLYDPAGLAQVLSKAKTPVYRLQSVDDLNALLAISSHANQPR